MCVCGGNREFIVKIAGKKTKKQQQKTCTFQANLTAWCFTSGQNRLLCSAVPDKRTVLASALIHSPQHLLVLLYDYPHLNLINPGWVISSCLSLALPPLVSPPSHIFSPASSPSPTTTTFFFLVQGPGCFYAAQTKWCAPSCDAWYLNDAGRVTRGS